MGLRLPRLRFSLLTLVMAVMLIGAGATLWWNWGPWAPVCHVETTDDFAWIEFSPHDTYFYAATPKPEIGEYGERMPVRLFSAETGRAVTRFNVTANNGWFSVSSGEKYVVAAEGRPSTRIVGVYAIKTHAAVEIPDFHNDEVMSEISFSPKDTFAVYTCVRGIAGRDHPRKLVQFSGPSRVHSFVGGDQGFSRDERWFAYSQQRVPGTIGDRLFLVDCGLMTVRHQWELSAAVAGVIFSPDDRMAAVSQIDESGFSTALYECESGKRIGTAAGMPLSFSSDGARLITNRRNANKLTDLDGYLVWNLADLKTPALELKGSAGWSYLPAKDLFVSLNITDPISAFDARTGAMAWNYSNANATSFVTHDFIVQLGFNKWSGIRDLDTGRVIHDFSDLRWRQSFPRISMVAIPNHSSGFLTESCDENNGNKHVTLWRKRRPQQLWGVAWLPEFWITAGLVLGLGWSLFRK